MKSSHKKNQTKLDFYLPNFCSWQGLLSLASISVLVALIISLIRWQKSNDILLEMLLITIFLLWISFSCAITLCVARRWLLILHRYLAMALTYLIVLSMTVIVSSIGWSISETVDATYLYYSSSREFFILNNLAIAIVITTIVLRYLSVIHQWRLRIESEAKANMQALLSRIRPHFLFNTMNTIAELTRTDGEAAEDAIVDLAELLRVTMRQTDQWITLEEELDICRTYVRVEQLRMGNRLQVNWTIDQRLLDVNVPLLCLQPLIENAVKHGTERMCDERAIKISIALVSDKRCCLTVENPRDELVQSVSPSGQRLALDNIRERLHLGYNSAASLEIYPQGDWFVVKLYIPVIYNRKTT